MPLGPAPAAWTALLGRGIFPLGGGFGGPRPCGPLGGPGPGTACRTIFRRPQPSKGGPRNRGALQRFRANHPPPPKPLESILFGTPAGPKGENSTLGACPRAPANYSKRKLYCPKGRERARKTERPGNFFELGRPHRGAGAPSVLSPISEAPGRASRGSDPACIKAGWGPVSPRADQCPRIAGYPGPPLGHGKCNPRNPRNRGRQSRNLAGGQG